MTRATSLSASPTEMLGSAHSGANAAVGRPARAVRSIPMSWNVVCPACGEEAVLAGGEDTDGGEIVMRRTAGEVVVRIWFTAGPFTNELLHTCEADDYRPNGPVPWKDHPDFPVRDYVARKMGDSVEVVASRVQAYAQAIGNAARDAWTAPFLPPALQPNVLSVDTLRQVEDHLSQAFDLVDPR